MKIVLLIIFLFSCHKTFKAEEEGGKGKAAVYAYISFVSGISLVFML